MVLFGGYQKPSVGQKPLYLPEHLLCLGPIVANFKGEYRQIANSQVFLVDSSLFFICL